VSRVRAQRAWLFALAAATLLFAAVPKAHAAPYMPGSDGTVLAELPAGWQLLSSRAVQLPGVAAERHVLMLGLRAMEPAGGAAGGPAG